MNVLFNNFIHHAAKDARLPAVRTKAQHTRQEVNEQLSVQRPKARFYYAYNGFCTDVIATKVSIN